MEIRVATEQEERHWNDFVKKHYPPIGAFMQSFEWGEFQKSLGRRVERYVVIEDGVMLACFSLAYYTLLFSLCYAYSPRGPVFDSRLGIEKQWQIFKAIRVWTKTYKAKLLFVRMEPPIIPYPKSKVPKGFYIPKYYIQPRYNLAIPLDVSETEILATFHPSTRSNISRAERRGVTVEMKEKLTEEDYQHFFKMMGETLKRNGGKDVYPAQSYFRALVKTIPTISKKDYSEKTGLTIWYAYQEHEVVVAYFVLFFAGTATYLFGASYNDRLSSKATTYLHWTAMKEAKKRGMLFYDLGGIDEKRWPTITTFKRQWRGREFGYLGNIDIPIRPLLYRLYNAVRVLRKTE
ncbi:peptidoglycan bridge formation glycyltransferase FemA/FemB family protein [Patescibacteria group bacterium]|nr:MAG: peptidoglycan bridge formation glycyltransferase FemA/FemB family protein [Patescibacteria group bacterium]